MKYLSDGWCGSTLQKINNVWRPPVRSNVKIVKLFEFSDVSPSIHKDGFWQSLM